MIRILIIFFMLGIATSCTDLCRNEKDPVKSAKALSNEQLLELYSAMENKHSRYKGYKPKETIALPKLKDINYKLIKLEYESIVIGGCFDNKTTIKFNGLRDTPTENEKRSITLSWGKAPLKTETLWEDI